MEVFLHKLVYNRNNTKHSTILMKPKDVNMSNKNQVWKLFLVIDMLKLWYLNTKLVILCRYPNISQPSARFKANFTEQLFKIVKIIRGNPNVYEIEHLQGEPITGKFYEENLSAIDKKDAYRV